MYTFTQLYKETAAGCGIPLTDSTNLTLIKRNINTGLKLLKSEASEAYTRKEVVAGLKAGQQYYTFNPDMLRVRNVKVNNGSLIIPLSMVESEQHWNALNIIPNFAVFYPQRAFIRGANEIGIWPTPSVDIANALYISYDARLQDMYLDDVTGVSITVTEGSTTITTTGTGSSKFAASMVGMSFTFTDGSDGQWYKIVGYTSTTQATIENYYPNATQTSTATIIGSTPDIPEAYQPALMDYAYYRFYKTQRGAENKANDFYNDFLRAQEGYAGTFGDKQSSQIILPSANSLSYNPLLVPPMNMQG